MPEHGLKEIPIFADLSEPDLSAISAHATTRSFPKNVVIINEGDRAHGLYLVLAGKVKVYLRDEHGREVILDTEGPGHYFGEIALLDDAPRSASVMTLEPSRFRIISSRQFRECVTTHPDVALNLIRHLTRKVRDLTENVRSLALRDVYGRIAKTLTDLAEKNGERWIVPEPLTHQDIASRIGASREMVSRVLKDLKTGGYIHVDKRRITITRALPAGW